MPQRLRSAWPSDALQDDDSPRCLNVRFRFGEVRPAPGRNLLAGGKSEQVLGLFRFPVSDGTEWTVKLTESELQRWGAGSPGTPRSWSSVPGLGFGGGGFTSGSTRRWSAIAAEDRFFFTRGLEQIMRWPAGSGSPVPATSPYEVIQASAGTVPTARHVRYYNERLIALDTTESGTRRANRIRWAVNGNHTDWSGTGSGFLDLFQEREEPLLNAEMLGDRLVIYRQHSIMDFVKTGVLTPVFTVESRVHGRGLGGAFTLASSGQLHFFLGNDVRVYAWDGSSLTNISEPIVEELQAVVDVGLMDTYFGAVSTDRGEYWLIIGGEHAFVYDYHRDSWSRDSFPSITALAEVEDARSVLTWAQMPSTWSGTGGAWDDYAATEVSVLWAGRSTGATFTVDESVVYDYFAEGSIVDRNVETPDYYLGPEVPGGVAMDEQGTIQRVLLQYKYVNAEPFSFEISGDRGMTWTAYQVTPNQQGYNYVDTNLTLPVVRFRFRENNATGNFRWRHMQYAFGPAGPLPPPS